MKLFGSMVLAVLILQGLADSEWRLKVSREYQDKMAEGLAKINENIEFKYGELEKEAKKKCKDTSKCNSMENKMSIVCTKFNPDDKMTGVATVVKGALLHVSEVIKILIHMISM